MVVIESAGPTDVEHVVRLAHDALAIDPTTIPSAIEHGCCIIARDSGAGPILGFAVACREEPCEGHITALAVDRMRRGEGIGKALLSGVRSEMIHHGARHLHLEVRADDPKAQAFYSRNGFAPEGLQRHAYQDGEDAVRYGRPI